MSFLAKILDEVYSEESEVIMEPLDTGLLLGESFESAIAEVERTMGMIEAVDAAFEHFISGEVEVTAEAFESYQVAVSGVITALALKLPVEIATPAFESLSFEADDVKTAAADKKKGFLARAWDALIRAWKFIKEKAVAAWNWAFGKGEAEVKEIAESVKTTAAKASKADAEVKEKTEATEVTLKPSPTSLFTAIASAKKATADRAKQIGALDEVEDTILGEVDAIKLPIAESGEGSKIRLMGAVQTANTEMPELVERIRKLKAEKDVKTKELDRIVASLEREKSSGKELSKGYKNKLLAKQKLFTKELSLIELEMKTIFERAKEHKRNERALERILAKETD